MNLIQKALALSCFALALTGCESRTDQVDSGGVILSLSDFDGLPIIVSATGDCCTVAVGQMTLTSIVRNPSEPTSQLMNVEIHSYEVIYTREDTGTRVPPKLVQSIFGVVPVGGTSQLDNYPVLRQDQFNSQPFLDLQNFGIDTQTGSSVVRMRFTIRFFGRTISGDAVESEPMSFSVEVVP
jgi:hypothetical protein